MNDYGSPLAAIADFIEVEQPCDTLRAIEKQLTAIDRLTGKARDLLSGEDLSQPGARAIFLTLADHAAFKPYAVPILQPLLTRPGVSHDDKEEARRPLERTTAADTRLIAIITRYYAHISRISPERARKGPRRRIDLRTLNDSLKRAATGLVRLLHAYTTAAGTSPCPVTASQLEEARANIRHNRAEIIHAAAQIPPSGHLSGNPETDNLHLSVRESIVAISNTLERLDGILQVIERLHEPATAAPIN